MIKICSTCEKRSPKEPLELEVETHGFCRRTETDCVAAYLSWNLAGCPGTLPDYYKTTWKEKADDDLVSEVQR